MTNKPSSIKHQPSKICPYPGPRSFNKDESLYFKGRDQHLDEIAKKLEEHRFLLVTGASGDGKSSLIFAGLIPHARAGFLKAQFSNWVVADFRPERSPLHNLANSLAHHLDYDDVLKVESDLNLGYSALIDLYKNSPLYSEDNQRNQRNQGNQRSQRSNLIIIADQFEEFFTNEENYNINTATATASARIVVRLLIETARIAQKQNLPVYIILTMRSDYFGHCTAFMDLPKMIVNSQFYLERLTRDDILQTLKEPAILSGNKISERLLQVLLNELSEDIGVDMLPIMQHCMYQIWKASDEGKEEMDLIHYAIVGGISKNKLPGEDQPKFEKWLAKLPEHTKKLYESPSLKNVLQIHANRLFDTAHEHYNNTQSVSKTDTVSKEEAQRIIKVAFQCLTKIDENRSVRNLMSLQEITDIIGDKKFDCDRVGKVLNIFRLDGNTFLRPFVTKDTETVLKPETILDITHEALMRNWSRLEEWAWEEHERVIIYRDLCAQLDKWLKNNKSKEHLLSAGSLSYFEKWYKELESNLIAWLNRYIERDRESVNLNTLSKQHFNEFVKQYFIDIKEYLKISRQNIDKKKKIAKAAMATISVLLVIAVIALFWAIDKRNEALELKQQIARTAHANEIATNAFLQLDNDPTLAFRLAEQAHKIESTKLSKQVIMAAYGEMPFYQKFFWHNSVIVSAKFSADGKYILTASWDKTARLFDFETKKELVIFKGHNNMMIQGNPDVINFSPDSRYIVTASLDSTARLWNLDGNCLSVMKHDGPVNSVVFSPKSPAGFSFLENETSKKQYLILTASSDKTAKLWDIKGNEIKVLKGHTGGVRSAKFSPDKKYILTTSEDNTLRLWNLNGNMLKVLNVHSQPVNYAEFSFDGNTILSVSMDNTAILWDLNGSKKRVLRGHKEPIRIGKFSPDGEFIITVSDDKTARLWNSRGDLIVVLEGHTAPVVTANFSSNGKYIVTGSNDMTCRLWDMEGKLLKILKANDLLYTAYFSPDSKYIITSHNAGTVCLWNINNLRYTILRGHSEFVWEATWSPDGNYIATASWDNTARIWDKNGEVLSILEGHIDQLDFVTFSPNGQLIVTVSNDHTARLWNLQGDCLRVLKGHSGFVHKAIFSMDGKYIVTPSDDGTARIWDIEGNELAVLTGHNSIVWEARFSPDSNIIVTASGDGIARIWDLKGNLLQTLKGHKDVIYRVVFSPDGKYIATASHDRTVRIWDLSGNELAICRGHTSPVVSVNFSHSGKYIATTDDTQTARLWDLNGNEIQVFRGHTAMINTVYFSSDDKYILTSCDDATARLWNLDGNQVNVYKGHNGGIQDAKFSPDEKFVLTASSDGTARIWPLLVKDALYDVNEVKICGDVWEMTEEDKIAFGIIK